MTFATLFPDNVERLVLDGVLDAPDYFTAEWSKNLQSVPPHYPCFLTDVAHRTIDKGLEIFADSCAQAGPKKCALSAPNGTAVLARIQNIFDSLKVEPISFVLGNGSSDYGIVDYGGVRRRVHNYLYNPFAAATNFSLMMAGLEKGDATLFWEERFDNTDNLQCTSDPSLPQDSSGFRYAGSSAIACGDGGVIKDTLPELIQWYENNAKESSFADIWPYRVACA